jgi:DNA-binding transcriptional regulator GbsR (MarR family)
MTWKDSIRKVGFDSEDIEDYVRQMIKEFTADGNVSLWDMVEVYNSANEELLDTLKDLDIEQIFDEMIEQIEKLEKTMKEVHSLIKQEKD